MIFNSIQFLWLFPIIFILYYLISWVTEKYHISRNCSLLGNIFLIIVSYALYLQWDAKYALILLSVTIVTYFGAILLDICPQHKRKVLAIVSVFLALLPLLIFKYTSFIYKNIEIIIGGKDWNEIKLIAPLGISFYTFQALGYLLDVYHKRINSERNWWNYMLFVCFFPQILSGPISKGSDLLPQIKSKRYFDYGFAVQGLRWLLWGMFLKVALADRLALYVNPILDDYNNYSGISIIMACTCYTFQIYGDFAGYSLMAIGVARLMGFDLINNFKRPYLAASITEFWKRWHISLTKWLTTHVYIAMGGNRCTQIRQYINIMTTFLVSGIWHGANWTFIIWGVIHGIFQIIEKFFGIHSTTNLPIIKRIIRICITFVIINLAWLIFRMPTITDAWNCFCRIFTNNGNFYQPPMDELVFLIFVLTILIIKDVLTEFKPNLINRIFTNVFLRRTCYVIITLIIIIMGVFNANNFIYLQF